MKSSKFKNRAGRTAAIALFLTAFLSPYIFVNNSAHSAGASLFLNPSSSSPVAGSNFYVDVRLNTGGNAVVAVSAYLTFDTARLQFVSIDAANSAFGVQAEGTASGNLIKISRGQQTPGVNSSNALVARVNFKALNTGTANINFSLTAPGQGPSRVILDDGQGTDILSGVTNGVYTIISSSTPPPSDTTAPTVSITAPAANTTVSGTVTVTASVSDNVGVTKVEFFVDGVIKSTDTASPYSFSWDTTNGGVHPCIGAHTHGLTAKAYDAAGNTKTSSAVTVNMDNPSYCTTAPPPPSQPPPSSPPTVNAALFLSPGSGFYTVGDNFAADVRLNSGGQKVVAVSAYLTFDSSRLEVSSIDSSGSSFSIKAEESVSGNTIKISRGEPTPGVNNSNALVAKINFKARANGDAAVVFALTGAGQGPSRVILDDGQGTDILSGVTNASYSLILAPPSGTSPPPTSTKFSIGDRVKTSVNLNVRSSASLSGAILETQILGSAGSVVAGPTWADDYWWWNINYDSGPDGWSAEEGLVKDSVAVLPLFTSPPALALNPPAASYNVGDNITLEVRLNTGGRPVVAISAYLTFDSSRLEAVSIDTSNSIFSLKAEESISGNLIKIGRGEPTPGVNNSNALVAKINFKAKATGSAAVNFSLTSPTQGPTRIILNDGYGTDILASVTNGSYSILSASTPIPTVDKFSIGDRVQTTAFLHVRADPSLSGSILGIKGSGQPGTVIAGPRTADGYVWWQINYDSDPDGWSVQNWLTSSSIPPPTTTTQPSPTPTSTSTTTPSTGTTPSGPKFSVGARVQTSAFIAVKSSPSLSSGTLGTKSFGSAGTIVGGPNSADNYWWWSVDFDSSPDGWVQENWLVSSSQPAPAPSPTPSPTPTSTPTPTADTTPPIIVITSPTGGSTLSGLVTVSATASDNVGVVGVQFKVDGEDLEAEITTPPYSFTADSSLVQNGLHTLTAVARDAAGNEGTSPSVSVTVQNAAPTPSTKFSIGDRIQALAAVNVRSGPSLNDAVLGIQAAGSLGTVIGGPKPADGYWWWEINYDSGFDGWSAEPWLGPASASAPSPTPSPAPTPTPTPTVDKFSIGDRVQTTAFLHVRADPSLSGSILGIKGSGQPGTVIAGPRTADGYVWWQINYDSDPDGWSVQNWLVSSSVPPPTTTTQPTPTPTSTTTPSTGTTPSDPKFSVGARVQTSAFIAVKSSPSLSSGTLGTKSFGSAGTIVGGPNSADNYWWWSVDFDSSPDGWVQENWLVSSSQPAPAPSPTPSPTPTSTSSGSQTSPAPSAGDKFAVGNRVQTTAFLNVRSQPSLSGTILGTKTFGQAGAVIAGPQTADGYTWWQINYDVDPDGWSAEDWLKKQ